MLRRFAAGSVVASVAIAMATAVALLILGLNPERLSLILALWCTVPCVWGLWAMLAPSKCVPQHLPVWGSILGLIAGLMAMFVLNLPFRIFGVALSVTTRAFGVLVAALLYYLLWIIVKIVYEKLAGSS